MAKKQVNLIMEGNMNILKRVKALAVFVIVLYSLGLTVSSESALEAVAVWDMSSYTYSTTGGDPTTYYIDDASGNNRVMQAYYGSTYKNDFVANSSYSQQKYSKMESGPYFIRKYNAETSEYEKYDEELMKVLDDKYTFETWVKFPQNSDVGTFFMVWDESSSFWNTAFYTGRAENGEVPLVFRRFCQSGQRYFSASKKIKTEEWTHVIMAYDSSDDGKVDIYINGEKTDAPDLFNMASGGVLPHTEGKTIVELARYFENTYQPLKNTLFGRTAFYSGLITAEEALAAYNSQKNLYENGFTISVENNNQIVSDEYKEGSFKFTVNCVDVDLSTVTTDSVKIFDEGGNEITYTPQKDGDNYVMNVDFIGEGEFKIVFDASISDKNGEAFRKNAFEKVYEVKVSETYRDGIKDELNQLFKDESVTDTMLMNKIIDDYNYILKLDVKEGSDYSKIINKSEVFGIFRKEHYESFDDIKEAFLKCVESQSLRDVQMAVEEFNLASQEKNTQKITDTLFVKYKTVYNIDDTQYKLLKNPQKAIEKLYNLSFSKAEDVVKKFYECVKERADEEKRDDFILKLQSETPQTIEILFEGYKDVLDVDFKDENYLSVKEAVIGDILANPSQIDSADKFRNKFYSSVLLHSLNGVLLGDRAKIGEILNKYSDYWIQPENYKNADNTIRENLYIKLNGLTHPSLDSLTQTVSQLIDSIKAPVIIVTPSYPSSGGGGGMSHSSSVKGGNFSTNAGMDTEIIPPTKPEEKIPFEDLSDVSWAVSSIETLYKKGIINGKSEKTFAPDDFVTRSEIAKMVCIAFEIKKDGRDISFSDISPDDWSFEYVCALSQAGIVNGQADKIFGKNEKLYRADLALILNRLIDYKHFSFEKNAEKEDFSDDEAIPSYAKDAVYKMQEMGIINGMGDGTFSPLGYVTRAQAAKVICQIMNIQNGGR